MESDETQTLLDNAARKRLAWQLAGNDHEGHFRAMSAAIDAYAETLIAQGKDRIKADRWARVLVERRAFELWHAEAGSPDELTMKISRYVSYAGRPLQRRQHWEYHCTGPDGRQFRDRNGGGVMTAIYSAYPGVTIHLVKTWENTTSTLTRDRPEGDDDANQ